MRRIAAKECWPCIEVQGNGGLRKEYPVEQLPADIQTALKKKAEADRAAAEKALLPALRQETLPAIKDELPALTALKGWQREVMDARVALMREFSQMEAEMGTSKAAAEFIHRAAEGTLPQHVQALFAVANVRGGKNGGRTISLRTLMNWKRLALSGPTALAPADVERVLADCDREPAWAQHFRACWHRPGNPSLPETLEAMRKILPEGMKMPTYAQARRWNAKRSVLERERGRKTGSALRVIKGCRHRDTDGLLPMQIGTCDGHTFKAKIAHPVHGRPFSPEVCAVIDVASRYCFGWSAGLAESAQVVADAVRHAATAGPEKPIGGIFDILYTDNGAGNTAKVNTDDVAGLWKRIGTTFKTGIPGNPQGRGLIENRQKTLWIRAARELPSCTHGKMDKLVQRNNLLKIERDVKAAGKSDLLLTWPQFLEFCEKAIWEYNRRPCSALPKIIDPVTGLRRHMSPLECLMKHISDGWDIKAHQLEPAEIDALFRPRELRTVSGREVTLFGGKNIYWNQQLAHYHGQKVQVAYDIHDPARVQIWDLEDRFVCHADFRANSSRYMPVSATEHAADERAKRRAKIKLDNLAEIEAERRGIIEMQPVHQAADDALLVEQRREALVIEMQERPKKEAPNPLRMTDAERYQYWQELDASLATGGILGDKEFRFYESFRRSPAWKALADVQETLRKQA
ncbi:transposase [Candidatus Electronema sp. JM]|uniref:transposase n=1 Tax=Candidatus Electronema sp. JM TaxID=3401571 RepID=UPI003AA83A69